MRLLLILIAVCLTTEGYNQSYGDLLMKSYKKRSKRGLKHFYQNWNQEIQPISNYELFNLNDTVKQTYGVFKSFYKPLEIDSLGGSEFGSDTYKGVQYLIVQNFIKIHFTEKIFYTPQEKDDYAVSCVNKHIKNDSLRRQFLERVNGKLSDYVIENFGPDGDFPPQQRDTLVDSIINFRPQINCGNKLPLYLTAQYDTILNSFLGNQHLPLGAGGIMNPARSVGQSYKRKKFLEKYIKIWYGHWGGYWQLYSYPKAYIITFDKEMKYAKVEFKMIYEGGDAILRNDNGSWTLISARRTWIE